MTSNDPGNACGGISEADLEELRAIAMLCLDAKGLVITVANWVAETAEEVIPKLPADWSAKVDNAVEMALRKAYDVAFATRASDTDTVVNRVLSWAKGDTWHQVATGLTGALGGFGGINTAIVDLPASTTLILRSIQDIADEHGEDLSDLEVRAQCIAVFGLGGPLKDDEETEVAFFTARLALQGQAISAVMKRVVPAFSAAVGQKLMGQAVPILGAVAGAVVNPAFTQYYQYMAHAHFRLRKLERRYDPEQVQACFQRIADALKQQTKSRKKVR